MEDDVDLSAQLDIKLFEDLYLMGEDTQKISVVHSLPYLMTVDSGAVNNRIIPKIKQDLPSSSCEFQLATSSIYAILLQKYANPSILDSVIQGVSAKDPNVSYAWSQALFGCLAFLPEPMVHDVVLPLAKNKFQPNSPVQSKVFCGRLMGEMCANVKFRVINLKRDILPIVIGLCQDGQADVRSQMCAYLPNVAKVLGNDWEKTNFLSCIVELARDENLNVRSTSIVAISSMMKIVSQETSRNTLLPLIKSSCEKAEESVMSALILAGELGTMLQEMPNIHVDDLLFFVQIYKKLSQKGKQSSSAKANASLEVMIRQRCASSFNIFMKFVKEIVPGQMNDLYTTYREHSIDPCYLVRKAAAAGLASLCQLLGKDNKMMKNEIVRMLRDDAVEVLEEIVPTIATIFASLADSGLISNQDASQTTVELCKAVIKCQNELRKRYNFRLSCEFMKQLEILPMCVPANYIHSNFTPLLFDKLLNGKARPIKNQAARTIVVFMRFNFAPNQNKWIRDSLIRQTAQAKSCYHRLLYFYVCGAVLDIYSEKYFKQWFLGPCLTLATDKVQNVRWKFMHFSTRLKSMVSLAKDASAKQAIMEAISKLESAEKAKSVLDIIRIKKREPLPKYLPEMLRQEEVRMREEQTTNIKRVEDEPVKPPSALTSDNRQGVAHNMHFLEQHFYIDAGIKLETVLGLETVPKDDSEVLDTSDFIAIESCNITDDAKVNLRKLQSKLTLPSGDGTRNKRYSSIISAECFETSRISDQTLKRRSLNLQYCDSKIPVAQRIKTKSDSSILVTKQESTKNNEFTHSSLNNSTFIQQTSLISSFCGKQAAGGRPGPQLQRPGVPASKTMPVGSKTVMISNRPSTAAPKFATQPSVASTAPKPVVASSPKPAMPAGPRPTPTAGARPAAAGGQRSAAAGGPRPAARPPVRPVASAPPRR